MTSPKTFETTADYAEALLRHPALPAGLDAVPALPPYPAAGPARSGWTFRPTVLASLVDALAGRGEGEQRTRVRYDDRFSVATLVEPTGQDTPIPLVCDFAAHCPPPPTVRRALDAARWTVAEDQPAVPSQAAETCTGVLATPDRRDVEENNVDAAPDVELLDLATWVVVSGRWCHPSRPGRLIVPAGLVALYEPEINGEPVPDFATLPENQDWLPDCRYCGLGLVAPCSPGDRYPHPDLGPDDSPWCPQHPEADRSRPHAPIWRITRY